MWHFGPLGGEGNIHRFHTFEGSQGHTPVKLTNDQRIERKNVENFLKLFNGSICNIAEFSRKGDYKCHCYQWIFQSIHSRDYKKILIGHYDINQVRGARNGDNYQMLVFKSFVWMSMVSICTKLTSSMYNLTFYFSSMNKLKFAKFFFERCNLFSLIHEPHASLHIYWDI